MRTPVAVVVAFVAGCTVPNGARPCSNSAECDLRAGGECTQAPSGSAWCSYPSSGCPSGAAWGEFAGDSLAGACVSAPGPIDASPDAPVPDATVFDAPPMPDAGPAAPPVTNGQAADIVLGQTGFTATTANAGGQGAGSLSFPSGAASDGTRLWVADALNGRALQYDSLPTATHALANLVLGQAAFNSTTSGLSQTLMATAADGMRVASDGTRVLVSDMVNNRVLIWNLPVASGEAADVVVGQPNFTSNFNSIVPSGMYHPAGIWTDGTTLIVVDNGNSRVLIWHTFPLANDQPSDTVLGRPDYGSGSETPVSVPPTAGSMNAPTDVFSDGVRLFVADSGNNRVMVWETVPGAGENGKAADYFIGQDDGMSGSPNAGAGTNAAGLSAPSGVVAAFGSLFITDAGNHRVVVHTPIPTVSGETADAVLGQPDLMSGGAPSAASASNMNTPRGIAVAGVFLWVVDNDMNRVTRYQLNP